MTSTAQVCDYIHRLVRSTTCHRLLGLLSCFDSIILTMRFDIFMQVYSLGYLQSHYREVRNKTRKHGTYAINGKFPTQITSSKKITTLNEQGKAAWVPKTTFGTLRNCTWKFAIGNNSTNVAVVLFVLIRKVEDTFFIWFCHFRGCKLRRPGFEARWQRTDIYKGFGIQAVDGQTHKDNSGFQTGRSKVFRTTTGIYICSLSCPGRMDGGDHLSGNGEHHIKLITKAVCRALCTLYK